MSKVSIFKIRIVKAIKSGNNEERYIAEACKVGYNIFDFHAAMKLLQRERMSKVTNYAINNHNGRWSTKESRPC